MQDLTRHLSHYLSLFGVIIASLLGMVVFHFDREFQAAIAISAGAAFFVWGIMHHHIHDDLHPKIIMEYASMAALGIVVFLFVLSF